MTRLDRRRRCPCAFGLLELLVVISILGLLVSFLLPSLCSSRETANRVKCSSNLRQIGQALLLYAQDNHGAYPRTTASAGPRRTPTAGTDGPAENDVTAALFLLLRTQDITAEGFVCPSSNAEKDTYDRKTPAQRSNFTDYRKNLSYSFQNPYPDDAAADAGAVKAAKAPDEELAVAADLNPGTSPVGADDVLRVTVSSSAKDMKLGNSNNHDKDGQNILYRDGHVGWESNPLVGVSRDNIYTTRDGKVNASPVDAGDSILLPTDD